MSDRQILGMPFIFAPALIFLALGVIAGASLIKGPLRLPALLALMLLVSAYVNDGNQIKSVPGFLLSGGVFFFASYACFRETGSINRFFTLCAAAGGVLGIIAVSELLLKRSILYENFLQNNVFYHVSIVSSYGRALGPMGHWVPFGAFLALTLLAGIAAFLLYEKPVHRALFGACIALNAAGLLLTFTRGAIGSFIFGCAVFSVLFWGVRKGLVRVAAVIAIVLALGLSFSMLRNGFQFRLDPETLKQDILYSHRAESYPIVYGIFRQNPVFGVGYGNLSPIFYQMGFKDGSRPPTPDNMYLSLLAETGIAGLACFLLMAGIAFKKLSKALKHSAGSASRIILTTVIASLSAILLNMATFDAFYSYQLQMFAWILFGAAYAITGENG